MPFGDPFGPKTQPFEVGVMLCGIHHFKGY